MRVIENRQVDEEQVGTFNYFEEPPDVRNFQPSHHKFRVRDRVSLCGLT